MKPLVSVVMSVYNGEKYLEEAINSILNQTFKDFEFIIINDCSTDRTSEILQSYNDVRIKIINNENNVGLTKSLNKGLKIARGQYVARMDADDISMPERLEKQVSFMVSCSEIGVLGTNAFQIGIHNQELGPIYPNCFPLKNEAIKKELEKGLNYIIHGSVMFRKMLLTQVTGYNPLYKVSQDYDLWLRMMDLTDFENFSERLYCWRVSPDNINSSKRYLQNASAVLALECYKGQTLSEKEISRRMREASDIDTMRDQWLKKLKEMKGSVFCMQVCGQNRDLTGIIQDTNRELPRGVPFLLFDLNYYRLLGIRCRSGILKGISHLFLYHNYAIFFTKNIKDSSLIEKFFLKIINTSSLLIVDNKFNYKVTK